MRRRTRSAAATLAACTAVLLTACGGAGTKANDETAEADHSDTKASAGPGAGDTVARPEAELPNDLTDTFEGWHSGDPAKDGVLQDVMRRINATNYAITQGDLGLSTLNFYYTEDALADAEDWVRSITRGDALTGTHCRSHGETTPDGADPGPCPVSDGTLYRRVHAPHGFHRILERVLRRNGGNPADGVIPGP